MRWLAALTAVLLLSACTSDPPPEVDPPLPAPTSPPPWVTSTRPPEPTTRPLVLAYNARRPPIAVPKAVAEWVQQGIVDNWDQLGQPTAPLRVTDRSEHLGRLPMNTVAVVVADAVGPEVRVMEVDGVDPLRDPDGYPIQVQGPPHPPVTTRTVGAGPAGASGPIVVTHRGLRFGFLVVDATERDRSRADVRRLARRVDVVTVLPRATGPGRAPVLVATFWGDRLVTAELSSRAATR